MIKIEATYGNKEMDDIEKILQYTIPENKLEETIKRLRKSKNLLLIDLLSTDSEVNSQHANSLGGQIGFYGLIRIRTLKS